MFGERYIEVSEFIKFCGQFNIITSEHELEHYEKEGLMLSRARLIYPSDFIKAKRRSFYHPDQNNYHSEWPGIQELFDPYIFIEDQWAYITNDELVDSFDRAFDKGNIYLLKPELENFKPWNKYPKVQFQYQGSKYKEGTVKHYYAFWQIHQLYIIQQQPYFYQNYYLLKALSKKKREELFSSSLDFKHEQYRNFWKNGFELGKFYDSLSYFITLYIRERERAFAKVQENFNIKQLNTIEYTNLKKAYFDHAQIVCQKFQFTETDLYGYLRAILKLRADYAKAEKVKLKELSELDISFLYCWIWALTGKSWNKVSEKLPSFEDKFEFRRIDPETKRFDESMRLLESHFDPFFNWNLNPLPNKDYLNEILEFCKNNNLDIFLHILPEFIVAREETRKLLPQTRYTNLKNLTSFFEYFLKEIAVKAGINIYNLRYPNSNRTKDPTIAPIIDELKALANPSNVQWYNNFNHASKNAKTMHQLVTNIQAANLITNPNHNSVEIEKNIIIANLARNFTTHNYTLEDEFYGPMFGELSSSVILSTLYFWHLAKIEGWV